jgi:cytosine/adenosine deaminase-related metal-dependent hydrolase
LNQQQHDVSLVTAGNVLRGFDSDGRAQWSTDTAVAVSSGRIVSVGPTEQLRAAHPEAEVSGGPGFVLIPGLVNAHHHVGLTPFQLGSADQPLELWFATRLALPGVDLGLDTLYSAMEMIATGVTTVQHLHSRAPGSAEDLVTAAEGVIAAYRRIGMRVSYSMGLRDQNRLVYGDDEAFAASLPNALAAPIREYFARYAVPLDDQAAVFHELRSRYDGDALAAIQLAPTNLHWLSDDALELTRALHDETGAPMHMHLLETPYQLEYARRRTGGSAVAFLADRGLLNDALTVGHGVWLTPADIERCAEAGVRVCHNRSSNFRLSSGNAPVPAMLAAGIEVAIGIDEAGINDDRDMLQEMRLVHVTNRPVGLASERITADAVLRMATLGGAATTPFADRIGVVEPGREADLVLLDWDHVTHPYQHPGTPLADVLIQRARAGSVHSVMIAGRWVFRDREFTMVDRPAVLREVGRHLRELEPTTRALRELADEVVPHVGRFYDDYDLAELRKAQATRPKT